MASSGQDRGGSSIAQTKSGTGFRAGRPWGQATPHQLAMNTAVVAIAVSRSTTGIDSFGAWANRTSPAPNMTHGTPPEFTKWRMSAPYVTASMRAGDDLVSCQAWHRA